MTKTMLATNPALLPFASSTAYPGLRYLATRDARGLFEPTAGQFERFWGEAVSFWCDAGPVLGTQR